MGVTRRTVGRGAVAAAAVAGLSAALLLVPGGPGSQQAQAAGLTPFDGCAELGSWFADAARDAVGPYGFGWGGWSAASPLAMGDTAAGSAGVARESTAAAPAAGLAADAVGPGTTGTNVQEAGVDEPDLVKTQGDRMVVVRGDRLHVLDVSGDLPRELGSLVLPAGAASEVLFAGDLALVLGTSWTEGFGPAVDGPAVGTTKDLPSVGPAEELAPAEPAPDAPMTSDPAVDAPAAPDDAGASRLVAPSLLPAGTASAVLTLADMSDPENPTVVRVDEVEGGYVTAREHDGVVRVVLQSSPTLAWTAPDVPGDPVAEARAKAANTQLVDGAQAQDWLPQRLVRDDAGALVGTEPLLDCADVSHPVDPAGIGVTTVLTLSLADPAAPGAVAVAADGDLVYASADRLYVATMRGGWAVPVSVQQDPAWPGAAERAVPQVRTAVHAFDVSADDRTAYLASGEVDGWLMGRWAMSEEAGRLRVATTREGPWSGGEAPSTDAAVSVLEERGADLVVVGSVGGLGAGEQVRAVRWFGDVATVVTFRQTDPLYTLDLSDPTAPRVTGELKVPGYSAYLHPLGDGLLLGVGQDATQEGRTLGTQVSTFDLRELAAPLRVDALVEPESWSDVEGDSRAFTYLPETRTAVVPLSGAQGSSLWALAVGADGTLTESGRWTAGLDAWVARAVPVTAGRLAVVLDGVDGSTVTLVSAVSLQPLGSVVLS